MILEQKKDTAVFIGDKPSKLRYCNIIKGSVKVYGKEKEFKENIDYTIEYENGFINAISDSFVNYTKSPFYNSKGFDHNQYPSFGNYDYTYWVDYSFEKGTQTTDIENAQKIAESYNKLKLPKKDITYVVFGDSISTGCEATVPENTFFSLFAAQIEKKYNIKVDIINKAVGGDSTDDGMKHFDNDVPPLKPDLVTIGFGMNDQNKGGEDGKGHFVEPPKYRENIEYMINTLLNINCAVVLISPCIPNSLWRWTSGDIEKYTEVLRELAHKYSLPLADVTPLWKTVLEAGKSPQSLLYNDINHPNDYGHTLYAAALNAIL